MTNRTDFEMQAAEIADEFLFPRPPGIVGLSATRQALREKVTTALHDAFVAGQESETVERALLREVYSVLREPDNGHHYCRGCDAGTHNGWKHARACCYEARGAEVIRMKSRIREAIGDPTRASEDRNTGSDSGR